MNIKKQNSPKEYFNRARSWADDNFSQIEQSRNRYQLAFVLSMGLNIAASIALAVLANYQTLIPMMVHHYDNGVTTVEALKDAALPLNRAQVESDIARYIENRESFDVASYRAQFDVVNLLSASSVASEYLKEQDKSDKDSPINLLGANGSRAVHLYSINFLDKELLNKDDIDANHGNVAEVVFSLKDTDKSGGKITESHYSALISWQYLTPSKSPNERWKNWDGFQVTRYSKNLRNV